MDLPPASRFSVTTYGPDGQRTRLGRYRLQVEGTTVRAAGRRGQVIAEITVTGSEHPSGNNWTLTAQDGSYWQLAGCACGG